MVIFCVFQFFYLVTETYTQGNMKEMRKWAYEIHSTFLVEKAVSLSTTTSSYTDKHCQNSEVLSIIVRTWKFNLSPEGKRIPNCSMSLEFNLSNELEGQWRVRNFGWFNSMFGDKLWKRMVSQRKSLKNLPSLVFVSNLVVLYLKTFS